MTDSPPNELTGRQTSVEARGKDAASHGELNGVSIVVPAYNEAQGVGSEIEHIRRVMDGTDYPYELIVVDDGSTDGTGDVARQHNVHLIAKKFNRGYGAALKTGIAAAKYDWILITDADGTYPAEAIPSLLASAKDADMVVAARTGEKVQIPMNRRPMKWVVGRLANYLAGQPIPDLNSGMRVFRKPLADRFEHLLPSGFSFTTTITMAMLFNDFQVQYLPINYNKRVGLSKMRALHVYDFLLVILRTVIYFNPLRFFLPFGGLLFLAGLIKLGFDVVHLEISSSAVMFILGAMILWAVGLISDQISRIVLSPRVK